VPTTTPDGALVILRWDVDVPRLVANAVALLGASRRPSHRRASRSGVKRSLPDIFNKKRPFSESETAEMAAWDLARPVILPGRHVEEPARAFFAGTTLAQYVADAPGVVGRGRPAVLLRRQPGIREHGRAFAPILLYRRAVRALRRPRRPAGQPTGPFAESIAYFACLGLRFIAVELTLLQH
jgi:hypothetical protein